MSARYLKIQLSEEMFNELQAATAECNVGAGAYQGDTDGRLSEEEFATQCVVSVLASRRLKRMYP